ncbi:MAG TPA: YbaB/EbfC family nucleoid-associated protein [Calditerricola sp.]|uniref:Nucleoid-associated protein GCM10007043_22770 n=1 Tax=Calditerricola satsumensis TaxID=373054 RepID=A0A8J3BAY7_9BACI|nr:YbaB/EbfC family nucleoid-associated protein [Calditerricola satsumensis]GGK08153.1 nucleoid-associated protein [Calditerricola satsumensis]
MRFGGNMNQMMKQVKKLQEQMQQMQAELKNKTVEGTAGGGMVTVTMNGHKEVLAVRIRPEAVDPDDVEMLEDLVRAAVNNALKAVDELIERDMGKLAGGINLPGLF